MSQILLRPRDPVVERHQAGAPGAAGGKEHAGRDAGHEDDRRGAGARSRSMGSCQGIVGSPQYRSVDGVRPGVSARPPRPIAGRTACGLDCPFASDAGPAVGASAVLREDPLRTFTPKPADINRAWHVIDAEGQVLGKVATEVATLLARQAQADLGPPRRHRRPRHRRQRRQARHQRPQARRQAVPPSLRATPVVSPSESLEHLLGRDPERVVRLADPRDAAEEPPRPGR